MKVEGVIEQLIDLKVHCESMIDEDEPGYMEDTWYKDKIALEYAINMIKKEPNTRQDD